MISFLIVQCFANSDHPNVHPLIFKPSTAPVLTNFATNNMQSGLAKVSSLSPLEFLDYFCITLQLTKAEFWHTKRYYNGYDKCMPLLTVKWWLESNARGTRFDYFTRFFTTNCIKTSKHRILHVSNLLPSYIMVT